jgi:hypothetical protein
LRLRDVAPTDPVTPMLVSSGDTGWS